MKSLPRALWITFTLLLAVAAIIAMREYLLLRNIQQVMNTSTTPTAAPPSGEKTVIEPAKIAFVTSVKRSGNGVSARVDFAAFKKAVEKDPAILASWGTLRWKVLEDTPALCVRNLGAGTPLAPLGVRSGDCITKLDGETINQPMRNLGIWLTLAQRSTLRVETLRDGETITYSLSKN
ncbi:MAG: PDZ domain-containing protein [Turneriella sp.]